METESKGMTISATGGFRENKNKPRLGLCPWQLMQAVSEVIWRSSLEGGGKYPMNNWRKGLSWRDTADCALRHLTRWLDGEDYDPESNLPTLWHVACNVAFLVVFRITHPEMDDRVKLVHPLTGTTGNSKIDLTGTQIAEVPQSVASHLKGGF